MMKVSILLSEISIEKGSDTSLNKYSGTDTGMGKGFGDDVSGSSKTVGHSFNLES